MLLMTDCFHAGWDGVDTASRRCKRVSCRVYGPFEEMSSIICRNARFSRKKNEDDKIQQRSCRRLRCGCQKDGAGDSSLLVSHELGAALAVVEVV